jgi:hypothetical protein
VTPSEAVGWADQAAVWVCGGIPGQGSRPSNGYLIDSLVCRYGLGEHHEALRMARERLALGRVGQGHGHGRQVRRLLIFARRLTRHVEGYVPPVCGWCSDTGVEYRRRDARPVVCHACEGMPRKETGDGQA